MRTSKIKAKLKRDEPVLLTTLHLTDPSLFELTSLMGFDGIWMDMEHHGYSVETATSLMRAARVGTADIMVRPAKGEFMRMGRMLEAGAQGIMYPRCDDADEARQVVTWSKFAPLGRRGFDGGNPDMPYCTMPVDELRPAGERADVRRDPDRGRRRPSATPTRSRRSRGWTCCSSARRTSPSSAASPASSTTPGSRRRSGRSPTPRGGPASTGACPRLGRAGEGAHRPGRPLPLPRGRHHLRQVRPGRDRVAVSSRSGSRSMARA